MEQQKEKGCRDEICIMVCLLLVTLGYLLCFSKSALLQLQNWDAIPYLPGFSFGIKYYVAII